MFSAKYCLALFKGLDCASVQPPACSDVCLWYLLVILAPFSTASNAGWIRAILKLNVITWSLLSLRLELVWKHILLHQFLGDGLSLGPSCRLKIQTQTHYCSINSKWHCHYGNGIELEAVGFQFEPYLWLPFGVTWDSSWTVNSRGNKASANLRPKYCIKSGFKCNMAPNWKVQSICDPNQVNTCSYKPIPNNTYQYISQYLLQYRPLGWD